MISKTSLSLLLACLFIPALVYTGSGSNSRIVIQDFENESSKLNQINNIDLHKGPRSRFSYEIVTNLRHSGKRALLVKADVNDPSTLAFQINYMGIPFSDWGRIKYFRCWILGTGTQDVFSIYLEDWEGEEFGSMLVNNWKGWKEIVIPLPDFHSRLDWQPWYAKINRKIDFPLLKILMPCFYYAKTVLAIDDMEFLLE